MESKASRKQVQERCVQMIRTAFPLEEGWEFNDEAKWKDYRVDFVIERRVENKRFRNIIKISYTASPLYRIARTLNHAARKMAGRYVKIEQKILVAPPGREFTEGDPSIKVWEIEDLVCKDNGVYWKAKE